MDKFSYAIGLGIGQNLSSMGIQGLAVDDFAQAIRDVLEGNQTAISHNEAREIVNKYFEELEAKMSAVAIEQGKAFLEENKKRPGIVTLPSGLQYEVINEGTGKKPKATDQVRCHYEGTLVDGTLFDSSIQRGEPAVFGVNQVIPGWVEALQLMSEGAKWKLYIPSDLGYGARGAGEMIPPHSTLVFEVELLEESKKSRKLLLCVLPLPACNLPTRNGQRWNWNAILKNQTKPLTDWTRQRQLSRSKRNWLMSAPLMKPQEKQRPAYALKNRKNRYPAAKRETRCPAPHRKRGFSSITRYIRLKRTIPALRGRINQRNLPSAARNTG